MLGDFYFCLLPEVGSLPNIAEYIFYSCTIYGCRLALHKASET